MVIIFLLTVVPVFVILVVSMCLFISFTNLLKLNVLTANGWGSLQRQVDHENLRSIDPLLLSHDVTKNHPVTVSASPPVDGLHLQ